MNREYFGLLNIFLLLLTALGEVWGKREDIAFKISSSLLIGHSLLLIFLRFLHLNHYQGTEAGRYTRQAGAAQLLLSSAHFRVCSCTVPLTAAQLCCCCGEGQPWTTVCKWEVWARTQYISFMDTDIWSSCNFLTWQTFFFQFFSNHIKTWKPFFVPGPYKNKQQTWATGQLAEPWQRHVLPKKLVSPCTIWL